ncbi:MAG: WYL domain-containing protein [Actinomycetaceae bacterium]|nr:WYL domain-containing protein [Actinomycetaceae bacterium]
MSKRFFVPLERRLSLIRNLLEARKPLTFEQIRERLPQFYAGSKLESAKKTFLRDREIIELAGVSIMGIGEDGSQDYAWEIDSQDFKDREITFTGEEMLWLSLAVALWEAPDSPESARRTLAKLRGLGESPLEVKLPTLRLSAPEHSEVLYQAIIERFAITFLYRGRGAVDATERQVEPWHLWHQDDAWYLLAWDCGKEGPRTFKLRRFASAPTTVGVAGAFERPQRSRIVSSFPFLHRARALVALRPGTCHELRQDSQELGESDLEMSNDDALGKVPDNWDLVAVESAHKSQLIKALVKALDNVYVLGPEEIRAAVVVSLEAGLRLGEVKE